MARVIKVELDTASLAGAVRELRQYRRELEAKVRGLMEALCEQGAELARVKLVQLDAVMFGDLLDSIEGFYDAASGVGIIKAGAPHAAFVEFGTGVAGQDAPHPAPDGWAYDVNGHGEDGWWYWGHWDGNWHWTLGMQSRPFLWETARELEGICRRLAKGVMR